MVLTGSLNTVLALHTLFTYHKLELIARSVGPYNEDMVRDLYASYIVFSKGLWTGGLYPPNRNHSYMSVFDSIRCIFLLLPFSA